MPHKAIGSFAELLSLSATVQIFEVPWGRNQSKRHFISGLFVFSFFLRTLSHATSFLVFFFLFLRTLSLQVFAAWVAFQGLHKGILCIFFIFSSCSWSQEQLQWVLPPLLEAKIPTQLVFWASISFWDSGNSSHFLWALKLNYSPMALLRVSVSLKNWSQGDLLCCLS